MKKHRCACLCGCSRMLWSFPICYRCWDDSHTAWERAVIAVALKESNV